MCPPMYRPLQVDLQSHTYTGLPFQLEHAAVPDRPVAPSHAREKRGRENVHRFSFFSYRAQSKASFAVFASVTAILFLILMCRSVRTRRDSWILTRRLSDDADLPRPSPDSRVLCVDSGEEAPEELSPTTRQTSLSAPKAKKARAEAGGERSAPSSPADENDSTSEGEGVQPLTSEGRRRKRRANELYSGFALSKDKHQTSSEEVPESPERGEEELEVASLLLSLQDSFATVFEPKTILPEPTVEGGHASAPLLPGFIGQDPRGNLNPLNEDLSSNTSLGAQAPAAVLGSNLQDAGRATGGAEATISSVVQVPAGGEPSSSQSPDAVAGGEAPSTSSAQHEPDTNTTKLDHPFYRLPAVDPFEQRRRRFSPQAATSFGLAFSRSPARLQAIRWLLLQPKLTGPQLDELAMQLHFLVAYGCYYEDFSVAGMQMSKAVYILGRRFMILDQVLCALEVLGEPPCGPWWLQFTAAMKHDLEEETGRSRSYRPLCEFNRDLVKRLSAALQTLKSGRRLDKEETIKLKQSLICLPFSPPRFRESIWDAWRQDDKEHRGSL